MGLENLPQDPGFKGTRPALWFGLSCNQFLHTAVCKPSFLFGYLQHGFNCLLSNPLRLFFSRVYYELTQLPAEEGWMGVFNDMYP